MSIEATLLVAAALMLLVAVLALHEFQLMLAVGSYSAVVVWLVWNNLSLVLPALLAGIVIGLVALAQRVRRELADVIPEERERRYIASQQIIPPDL